MKLSTLLVLLILFSAAPVRGAAVSIDGTPAQSGVSGSDTLTFSVDTACTNCLMAVGISVNNDDIATVAYNSVSLDPKSNLNIDFSTPGSHVALYYKTGIATGTADVVITTPAGDGCAGACTNIGAGAISFGGVDQATPMGAAQTGYDFYGTPVSVTVPTDGMTLDVIGQSVCDTLDPTDEQAEKWDVCGEALAHAQSAGATTTTNGDLPWNDASGYKGQIAVPINPVTSATYIPRHGPIIQ